ncbi:unnamed protein product [Amoebophrya sp. A25]|nr:unnamed protein product [Amoebophrya sp. A25]|eukprot:GSA25T00001859001.1
MCIHMYCPPVLSLMAPRGEGQTVCRKCSIHSSVLGIGALSLRSVFVRS